MFAFTVVLLGALYACDYLFESPREEASRRVELMAAAATARDPAAFLEHVSASFDANGANKERLRSAGMWRQLKDYNARVAVWGLGKDDFTHVGENEIEIGFYAKGAAPDASYIQRYIRAKFVKDADGQFRLAGMKFYDPLGIGGKKTEELLPGFP